MTSGWGLVAVTALAVAAGLVVGPAPRLEGQRPATRVTFWCAASRSDSWPRWSAHMRCRVMRPVLALVGAAAVVAARAMWLRRRRRQETESGQARVLEFCHLVASELAAGQPPGTALERGAAEWPELDPVANAFRLGGDVPTALRMAAPSPVRATWCWRCRLASRTSDRRWVDCGGVPDGAAVSGPPMPPDESCRPSSPALGPRPG